MVYEQIPSEQFRHDVSNVGDTSDAASQDQELAPRDGMNRRELLRDGAAAILPIDIAGTLDAASSARGIAIAAIQHALLRYGPDSKLRHGSQQLPPIRDLHRRVDRTWQAFQVSRYSFLGKELPPLLEAGQSASRGVSGDDRIQALRLLSLSYQLMAIVLLKIGDPSFGWLAADRAMATADASQDPLVMASSARILAYAFSGAGQHRRAREIALAAAGALDGGLTSDTPVRLSLYGALLQKASIAAAHEGDRVATRTLLAEAESAARMLGGDYNYYWTAFGPTNVAVHRVSAAVVLGDGGAAVEYSREVQPSHPAVVERRAHHLLDVAHGYHQASKDRQALETLLDAERVAPEEVRYQPVAFRLVSDLLRRGQAGPIAQLHDLAQRLGVTV